MALRSVETLICEFCGTPMPPRRQVGSPRRFCSPEHRRIAWDRKYRPRRPGPHSNKPTFMVENPAAVPAAYLTVNRDKVRRALKKGLSIPGIRAVESDSDSGVAQG